MIFRISTGTAHSTADADRYAAFLDSTVFPELRALPGHHGAYLLRREIGAHAEMMIITTWESIDAIRAFTGNDIEAAVFEPEAQRLLPDRDDRVKLYERVLGPVEFDRSRSSSG
jgi:heme-degrading monooxygenase HmoA